jgi:transcriptional regulator with XRE-family HTH domain
MVTTRTTLNKVGAGGTATPFRFDETIRLCNSGVWFERGANNMAKASITPRGPTAVDTHVGQKIRARRIFLQMSQTEVADSLGITFQQIQKYEKGMNRVGASRLQQISDVLGVSPFYFFEGAPTVGKKLPTPIEGELPEHAIVSFLGTREGAALVRGFLAIKQKPIRRAIIEFIDTFA